MKPALKYTVKIYLTTVITGPLILMIVLAVFNPFSVSDGDYKYGLLAIPVGLIFYLPSQLLLWCLATYLIKSVVSSIYIKIWLSLACLPLSVLPFGLMNYRSSIFDSNDWPVLAPFVCTYAGVAIIWIWVYKLQSEADQIPIRI